MNDFGSTMTYTLIVTLFGMGIVFIVLILLQYILESMRIIFSPKKKAEAALKAVSPVTPVEIKAAEPVQQDVEEDEEELFAVITAAVACCMGSQSNIVVRNITRVYDQTPTWGRTGRNEQMASRY